MLPHDLLPVVMAVGGYLLGSIPFGVVVSKVLGTVDPRSGGSRNIGFTNVLRVSGKRAGLLTLLGDAGKGWVVGWAALRSLDEEFSILVVTASPILGHLYPIFLGFRGGKGVATAMGAVAGVALPVGGTMLGLWLLTVAISRISSAGATAAFVALPLLGLAFGESWRFEAFALAISSLILVRHKENLVRLWKGTEPKIGRAG
jgi:glycerol-3-phosphate acyltransferase PlsY